MKHWPPPGNCHVLASARRALQRKGHDLVRSGKAVVPVGTTGDHEKEALGGQLVSANVELSQRKRGRCKCGIVSLMRLGKMSQPRGTKLPNH